VPLGSSKSYPVNIAVICATHRRIRDSVSSGLFREDLYFRLNGLTVMLPPLRARTDLDALVASLLRELGGDNPPSLDPEVLALFRKHPWPGNLRQLSNLLRTAVVMAEGEATIRREHLPDDFIEDVEQGLGFPRHAPPPRQRSHTLHPPRRVQHHRWCMTNRRQRPCARMRSRRKTRPPILMT
jgi:transcriptional regulator of acetoin/glycerol metabolism